MSIQRRRLVASALLLLGTALPTWAQTPSDEPNTDSATHTYVYYADHDIYYAPESHLFYWMAGGKWTSGIALPAGSRAFLRSKGMQIELDTDKPYERHAYVVAHYKTKADNAADRYQ